MNTEQPILLSVVSPIYTAEDIVDELARRISEEIQKITDSYEIIFIDDGSLDDSWRKIVANCQRDSRIKGIQFSKNFGQHSAISAGLEIARGHHVVVMDGDLQDNPKYLPLLYEKAQEGFDIVYTRQKTRNHSFFKNIVAKIYYKALHWLSNFQLDSHIDKMGCYSIISRKVVSAYLRFNDYRRAYLMVLQWLGFSFTVIPIIHDKRPQGNSTYSIRKLLKHAVNNTISYSDRLLYLSIYSGLFFSLMAFVGIGIIIYRYLMIGALEGWSSVIVTVMFFSGIILMALGVIGIYIAKLFEQTKNRPRYLISETINL